MRKPLVSIITPSYNSEKYIDETIQSVIAQTYSNWEMLIVDDCSNDTTRNIVKKYILSDSRIKLYELPHNSGPSVARNTAIGKANGTFLAFLDSDDIWFPNKLEEQIAYMLDNNYAFTYTPSIQIDENSQVIDQNR
ncbi:MAG: glycosyltransferase family 2 protein, partial [Bacteroidales bacterium]|nr:glycosyltransferase family 2 protein [Bacteroidales bacterium]